LGAAISPSIGFTGGGLSHPYAMAIDALGNVWMSNDTLYGVGDVAKLSNTGSAISPSTGYTGGGLGYEPTGIAIDGSGNVWVGNIANSLSEFTNAGVPLSPTTGFTGGGLSTVGLLAIDGSGNVWATNQGFSSYSVTEFIGAGTPVVTPLAVGVKNNMLGTRP